MSTKTMDYILGTPPPNDNALKGTLQGHLQEQAGEKEAQQSQKGTKQAVMETQPVATEAPKGTVQRVMGDENATQVAQTQQPASAPAQTPVTRAMLVNSYEDLIRELDANSEKTKAEDEKRQRRNKTIAAIGDGLSALANLYFTTQYAPDMKVGHNPMSEKMQARYDKLNALRDAEHEARYNRIIAARKMDNAEAKAQREWERQLGIDAYTMAVKKAELELKQKKENLDWLLKTHQIEEAKYKAEVEKIKAKNAETMQALDIEYKKSQINNNGKNYGTFDGKDYKNKADYDKAVISKANELGINVTEEQLNGVDYFNNPKTKEVRRPIADIAAEVDRRRKEQNPMGGSKKKPNPMS